MLKIDKKLFNKLPKYAQRWNWSQLDNWYNRYAIDAICDPLPNDKNQDKVTFTCDNWTEFIWWVRKYHNECRRMHE